MKDAERLDIGGLLARVDAGDAAALTELFARVEPDIKRIASRLSILRQKGRTQLDDLAQVRLYALLRLHRSRGTSLRRFLASHDAALHGDLFSKWFFKLVRYAAMDHLRAEMGRRPAVPSRVNGKLQPSKSDLSRPSDDPEAAIDSVVRGFVSVTGHLVVSEVTAFIETAFSPSEIEALRGHFHDQSYDEIAAACGLSSSEEAERLVRKLKERLRVRFRTQDVFTT
jgi:DNA-directed RNA polymerase specialized sigma24 family protein